MDESILSRVIGVAGIIDLNGSEKRSEAPPGSVQEFCVTFSIGVC